MDELTFGMVTESSRVWDARLVKKTFEVVLSALEGSCAN